MSALSPTLQSTPPAAQTGLDYVPVEDWQRALYQATAYDDDEDDDALFPFLLAADEEQAGVDVEQSQLFDTIDSLPRVSDALFGGPSTQADRRLANVLQQVAKLYAALLVSLPRNVQPSDDDNDPLAERAFSQRLASTAHSFVLVGDANHALVRVQIDYQRPSKLLVRAYQLLTERQQPSVYPPGTVASSLLTLYELVTNARGDRLRAQNFYTTLMARSDDDDEPPATTRQETFYDLLKALSAEYAGVDWSGQTAGRDQLLGQELLLDQLISRERDRSELLVTAYSVLLSNRLRVSIASTLANAGDKIRSLIAAAVRQTPVHAERFDADKADSDETAVRLALFAWLRQAPNTNETAALGITWLGQFYNRYWYDEVRYQLRSGFATRRDDERRASQDARARDRIYNPLFYSDDDNSLSN
jgi:hypothetical protein